MTITYGAGNYVEQTSTAHPKINVEVSHDPTTYKMIIDSIVRALNAGPKSRQRSLAITKLEEARMWLDEALRLE